MSSDVTTIIDDGREFILDRINEVPGWFFEPSLAAAPALPDELQQMQDEVERARINMLLFGSVWAFVPKKDEGEGNFA
jgi:hypothetical protein